MISTIAFALISLAILIAAFPFRNWLEIRQAKKKDAEWTRWLQEKPSREAYCLATNQKIEDIKCNFCGSPRFISRLESKILYKPKFGFINNKFQMNSYFKTYTCSGCNTQLFRERYEG